MCTPVCIRALARSSIYRKKVSLPFRHKYKIVYDSELKYFLLKNFSMRVILRTLKQLVYEIYDVYAIP